MSTCNGVSMPQAEPSLSAARLAGPGPIRVEVRATGCLAPLDDIVWTVRNTATGVEKSTFGRRPT